MARRLNRQENQQLTRARLLESAAVVFGERGVNGASVEQIAERAGFSRGAVYGNFEGKNELVLALLKDRADRELRELTALGREAGTFEAMIGTLRQWHRDRARNSEGWLTLRTELWLYALRTPSLLPLMAEHERRSREAIAAALHREFTLRGVVPPVPVEQLALIVHALEDGLSIQLALVPESGSADTVVDVTQLLLRSWMALGQAGDRGAESVSAQDTLTTSNEETP